MNENLYAILASRFPKDDDAPCLIPPDGRRYTYDELERDSARYAALMVSLGLQPGDRVAVQLEKTPQALLLYLGCLRAGCVFVPLNTAYQRGEIAYFLGDATPSLFVCRPQATAMAEALAAESGVARIMTLADDGSGEFADEAARMPDRFDTAVRADDDLAAILYTSGTTGRSKGAMLSHGNLASNALVLHRYWGWRQGDVLLHMLPIYHVHGLFVAVHCALLNGSPMLFEPRFDAVRALALLPQSTVFMGVPTYYTRLLGEPAMSAEVCRGMRLFISGSAPLLPDTFAEFRRRTGHTILERYGMTETGMLTSNPCDGERRGGTVGLPLPGTEVRVVDDEGKPCAAGEIGNIEVAGDNVFSGYWQMPEKSKEEFSADGFFKTGDMGRLDADGYVSIIGRSKDLIITGGLNVYPKEIESAIDALPGIAESAVIGVPHPDFGEAVAAVVVCVRGTPQPTSEQVIDALKEQLASFKVPKSVHFVQDLPRNTMGKVQKNLLRDRFG